MNCPGIERLIAHGFGQEGDKALEAHLPGCGACQADLLTIRALTGVETAEEEFPETLVAKIVSGLPAPEATPKRSSNPGLHLFLTGVLGTLTALTSLLASGSIGSVGPSGSLLLGTGFGAICVMLNLRRKPGAYPLNGEPARPDPA